MKALGLSAVLALGAPACSRSEAAGAPTGSAAVAPASSDTAEKAAPKSGAAPPSKVELPPDQVFEPRGASESDERPLILFLHGLGTTGKIAFDRLGLRGLAERERAFLVAPNGETDSQGRRFWNAHPACCDFDGRGVDDVARLGELLASWRGRNGVDEKRVYVVGFSNGGFMAHRLACRYGDRLAAIASIAGAGPAPSEKCASASSLAVLEVHGDADPIVRYDGGRLFSRNLAPAHGSALDTLVRWGKELRCSGQPTAGPAFDLEPALPGAETASSGYDSCKGGSASLWTVRGGNHYIGISAAFHERIWQFLSKHEGS